MEDKKSTFTLVDELGNESVYEMLFTFESDETKKSYMVFTDHSKYEDGKEKVYAYEYDKTGADKDLKPITTDKEWNVIEEILYSIPNNSESDDSSK